MLTTPSDIVVDGLENLSSKPRIGVRTDYSSAVALSVEFCVKNGDLCGSEGAVVQGAVWHSEAGTKL